MSAGVQGTGWLGRERHEVAVCASTNDLALERAKAGAVHGTVVIADAQTAGRGRLGRTWASPPGRNLYLSAIVRAPRSLAELAPLTLAVGVGTCDAIRAEGVAAAALKWPNDVFVGRHKLAGILCEGAGEGAVVVGIGVNLNGAAAELPPEVAARATTIEDELGRWVDRAAFVDRLLAALEPWIDRFVAGGVPAIAAAWEARMAADLRLHVDRAGPAGGPVVGLPLGLDRDGALRLRDDAGVVHRVVAGELTLA